MRFEIDTTVIPFAIPPLISAIILFCLGLFVAGKDPKSKVNRYFAFFQYACSVWLVGFAAMNVMKHERDAFIFSRIVYTGVALIPTLYFGFIANLLRLKNGGKFLSAFYAISALFVLSLWSTRLFLSGNIHYSWGFSSRASTLHHVFLVYFFAIFLWSFLALYKSRKELDKTNPEEANKVKYVFLAFLIAVCASTDYLSTYGWDYYPLGFLFMTVFAFITAYAIVKHRLMDIHVAIRKTALYTFWTLLLSATYAFTLFIIQNFLLNRGAPEEALNRLEATKVLYKWSGLVALATNVGIAIVTYWRSEKTKAQRAFSIFSLFIGLWAVGSSLVNIIPNKETALWILRANYAFGVFVPTLFLHFILLLTGKKAPLLWKSGYFLSTALLASDLTPYFLPGLRLITAYDFYISEPGVFYVLFFFYFCAFFAMAFWVLFSEFGSSSPEKKRQLRYIFLAYFIGMIAGVEYFCSVFGILKRPPADDYILVLTFLVLCYAIVKHGLLDIRVVIQKTLFYSLLASLITAFYVLIIFLVQIMFIRQAASHAYLLNSIALILFVTLFLRPVEIFFHRLLDKKFFKGTVEELSFQKARLETELERRERLKSVGILAAGMAHEIKNPITAIKTFAEYLPKKYEDPEFREKFSKILAEETERVSRIVKDLLAFSKPSEPNREAANLGKILKDVAELLSGETIKARIETVYDFEEGAPLVYVDASQIKQAFLNIIMNALEAMRPRPGRLTLQTRTDGRFVRAAIEDTGPGIPKDKLPHLFDPFFTDKEGGTGLGLAITHSIVEKNGGKISVESTPGVGTKFMIDLPTIKKEII